MPDTPTAAAMRAAEKIFNTFINKTHYAEIIDAEFAEVVEACKTFHEWLRREDTSPEYPAGTDRDTPGNEHIWREWFDENLRLCSLAQSQGRSALSRLGVRGE